MVTRRRGDPLVEWLGELAERLGADRWQPAVDVYETEKAVVVCVELAGVRRDDLRVTIDGDELHIRGERRAYADSDVQRIHRMEIAAGPFERTIRIGIPIERDRISARLEEGILRVVLPKRPPQQVEVVSGE